MAIVFISAHNEFDDLAQEVGTALKKAGHDVWWYQESLSPGDLAWEKTSQALEASDKYVIIYSIGYNEARPCRVEKGTIIHQCINSAKGLIIVQVDGAEIDPLLQPIWRLTVSSKNKTSEYPNVAREVVRQIDSCVFLPATAPVSSSLEVFEESQRLDGFKLIVDGMIVNAVADLLFPKEEAYEIRKRCREFYWRSLEDLAFGVVYSSRIITSKSFRPRESEPSEPGVKLLGLLGELCDSYRPDEKIMKGALLNDPYVREWIAADIRSLGRSLSDTSSLSLFGGWMIREAQKHLGTHSSLFKTDLLPSEYKFDVSEKAPYYENRSLQSILDDVALNTLVSYLPKSPEPGSDPYALPALREFATRNAVSLITIMWEHDLTARQLRATRLPHVVRGLVTLSSVDSSAPQQALLREIVVRAPLLTALQRTNSSNRTSLIVALLDLRDAKPFKETREVMEHEDLLAMEPIWMPERKTKGTGDHAQPNREQRAQRVLRLISGSTTTDADQQDRFILARHAALRRLGRFRATDYESEIRRVFPELALSHRSSN